MSTIPMCFFAFPSHPLDLVETIEATINDMNTPRTIQVYSWRHFSTPGKIVLSEVCRGIDASNIFACDLTHLNMNVLFELGYAISRAKYVWITIDPSVNKAKENYDKLGFLSTVINVPYQNHNQLSAKLLSSNPIEDGTPTLLESIIRSAQQQNSRPPTLFYLKSEINTESSDRLTRRVSKLGVPIDIDDPEEISSQTLAWYLDHTFHSYAVVAHFLGDDRPSRLLQNQKYSFVAGMAYGFDKNLLMLAHEPFAPGMDYKDLLQTHRTASDCIKFFDTWFDAARKQYELLAQQFERRQIERRAFIELKSINLGDHLAENERLELPDYFVETAAYHEALQGRPTILFVGRKGTGKTANLVKLSDFLKRDHRYHVCLIEPPAYEQKSVLKLLKETNPRVETGYMTESLWKFLVETELAKSVYDEIKSRPVYSPPAPDEIEFLRYMDEKSDVLGTDFAVRMENAIRQLLELDPNQPMQAQRARLSEILHREILAELRLHLGQVLQKKEKVFVLIDNLDKAWTRKADISYLSEFLFGLLGVSRAISEEFGRSGGKWKRVPLSLTIFLRSDIFFHVLAEAREPDKIEWSKIDWNDPILLQRIVEERVVSLATDGISNADVWQQFFVSSINGVPAKDYIVSRILPRPRDMIYFCKAALASAINHRHTKVQEDDISNAEKEYSYFALNALAAETSVEIEQMQDLLLLFAESSQVVTRGQVVKMIKDSQIPDFRVDDVISLLTESGFLGLETDIDQFEFISQEVESRLTHSKARITATVRTKRGDDQRFKINLAYHAWLDIRT